MNKKICYSIAVVMIIMFTSIAGCTSTTIEKTPTKHIDAQWSERYCTNDSDNSGNIAKIHIPEDDVTCYVLDNYEGGGISCFIDSDLRNN